VAAHWALSQSGRNSSSFFMAWGAERLVCAHLMAAKVRQMNRLKNNPPFFLLGIGKKITFAPYY
jgi:hypothetical protein